MSESAMRLRRSGRYRSPVMPGPMFIKPVHPAELKKALGPDSHLRAPFRPVGANSAATDGNGADDGAGDSKDTVEPISDGANGTGETDPDNWLGRWPADRGPNTARPGNTKARDAKTRKRRSYIVEGGI